MLIGRNAASSRLPRNEGEGYLASSADLMIGILFIFIIMVVYLAVEIKRVQSENTKNADPVRSLVEDLGLRMRAAGVRVELDPDGGVIALPADALFDKGAHIPREGALESIRKTNEVLSEVVPCYVKAAKPGPRDCSRLNKRGVELETVMIEGHTDSDRYANDPDKNWHLGLDRARFIFNELGRGELGSLKNRKNQPLLGVSSYADSRPAKPHKNTDSQGSTTDPKAKDRRVELRFILSYQGEGSQSPASGIIEAVKF